MFSSNDSVKIIERVGQPSKLDQAPYGTRCHVMNSSGKPKEIYMQTNADEENPIWEYIGTYE